MAKGIYEKAIHGDTWAIGTALRISERRAKLDGLDAPEQHDNRNETVETVTVESLDEFMQRLSEAKKAAEHGGN